MLNTQNKNSENLKKAKTESKSKKILKEFLK